MQFTNKIISRRHLVALPLDNFISRLLFLEFSGFKNIPGIWAFFCFSFFLLFFILISSALSADYSYITINDPFIRKIPGCAA